jgi:acetoin utilization deacetylase AcuC-like enzyme
MTIIRSGRPGSLTPRLTLVLRAHHQKHLERLRKPVDFDANTPYYPGIEEHALPAAGAAIGSVDLALGDKKGFSLIRPPGHHATATKAMGFCYLNSVAIAAHHALAIGCERVAIWDFDAHHGNGTESIVFGNNRIRFASVHQHPAYPGTGTVSREMSSIGQSHRKPVRKSMRRLFIGRLTVYSNSTGISSWSLPVSTLSWEIR